MLGTIFERNRSIKCSSSNDSFLSDHEHSGARALALIHKLCRTLSCDRFVMTLTKRKLTNTPRKKGRQKKKNNAAIKARTHKLQSAAKEMIVEYAEELDALNSLRDWLTLRTYNLSYRGLFRMTRRYWMRSTDDCDLSPTRLSSNRAANLGGLLPLRSHLRGYNPAPNQLY